MKLLTYSETVYNTGLAQSRSLFIPFFGDFINLV